MPASRSTSRSHSSPAHLIAVSAEMVDKDPPKAVIATVRIGLRERTGAEEPADDTEEQRLTFLDQSQIIRQVRACPIATEHTQPN